MLKPVVTTSWDDGSILDLKVAELLDKYGIKGTFYVPKTLFAHPVGHKDLIALDDCFEVGCHTLNHIDLTKVPESEARFEIEESKVFLEELLGHQVRMFSYPCGRFNTKVKGIVKKCGFDAARTIRRGCLTPPVDPYEWRVTSYLGRGIPHIVLGDWRRIHNSIRSLWDWEIRAKVLFDQFLRGGGIYHVWGHSLEYEVNLEWDKLERVLGYISCKEGISYLSNGEIFKS